MSTDLNECLGVCTDGVAQEVMMGSIHLIRIPDQDSRERAIAVFHGVQVTRVRLPGKSENA